MKEKYLCQIGNISSLLHLQLGIHFLPVVGHGKDGICTVEGRLDLVLVVDVGSHALDTPGLESFGIWLGRVSGDASYLELVGRLRIAEYGIDDGATLIASRTEDHEDFLVSHDGRE